MATFLFDKIIFGPVKSRRLGVSLGINLLPTNKKICSFDCIYCECGWTDSMDTDQYPSFELFSSKLEEKLREMRAIGELPDVITFAGNGEPTLHPNFPEIVDKTIELRNTYCPEAKIAVLSNSSLIHRREIFESLLKVDQNILKLDSAIESTIEVLNQPLYRFNLQELISNLKRFRGNLILQTLFIKGKYKGQEIDNTTDTEIKAWLEVVKQINPKEVMVYTIARDTPLTGLQKVSKPRLDEIANLVKSLGIPVQVSY
ncbi:radical SAM protein [Tenuifilum thalassicum]|uniref:Radical SAM protein n=1 Tax=Tenuifilum thalassicum TaxID=2590900 RepID=A0A7D4C1W4_9BACT|nr:radical SAM protein [Tenuifilum thalassicum]QKG80984.1 radical SAM protein [Tenuifilum thalassicum]